MITNFLPFNIKIPKDAKQSYRGKISSYYWIVDTKVDVPLRKDIHIKSMIELQYDALLDLDVVSY
jgi:hypothetical protein